MTKIKEKKMKKKQNDQNVITWNQKKVIDKYSELQRKTSVLGKYAK